MLFRDNGDYDKCDWPAIFRLIPKINSFKSAFWNLEFTKVNFHTDKIPPKAVAMFRHSCKLRIYMGSQTRAERIGQLGTIRTRNFFSTYKLMTYMKHTN